MSTAMEYIHNDPALFASYRIGVLEQRLKFLDNDANLTKAVEMEQLYLCEVLSTLKHIRNLLIRV